MTEAYDAALATAFDKVKEIISESAADGWTVFSDRDGVLLEQKNYPFCSINCFRATCLLDISPEEAISKVWAMTLPEFQVIDPNITDVSIYCRYVIYVLKVSTLETYEDGKYRCRCQENKLPWPVWPRRTVFAEKRFQVEDGEWDVAVSVENSNKPLAPNDFVRTTLHVGAYGFIKEGDKTRMWRVIHVDPNGSIPAMVVNAGADSVAAACRFLKK